MLRHSFGGATNQFTAGGGYDRSRADFVQSTELGYLDPENTRTLPPQVAANGSAQPQLVESLLQALNTLMERLNHEEKT